MKHLASISPLAERGSVCVLGAFGNYGNKECFVKDREHTGMLSVYDTSPCIITLSSTHRLFYFQDFFFLKLNIAL